MAKRNNLRLLHQGKTCHFFKTLWHNQCMLCNSKKHLPLHIWSAPNREGMLIFWIQQFVCNQQTINQAVRSRWLENMEPRLTVYREMSLHLKNYNALQNPFVQAIHVQQKALLSIWIISILHSKNLRSATQLDAAWPLPVIQDPWGWTFPFSPSTYKNTTRICTLL